jgi:hypothetical protein
VLKVIVANSTMIKAYKAAVPGNGQPFPDGSTIVKLQWKPKKSTEVPFVVDVPDVFTKAFVIEKDSKRFLKSAGGDTRCSTNEAASDQFTADPKSLSVAGTRPYGREGEGLHLPPVPEALNRACPDIKYPAQRMSLCEALFSTWTPVSAGSAANCTASCCLKEYGLARFELQSVGVPRSFSGQMTLR